ncbi:MAG: hypothetical protein Q4G06_08195 [Clostridia bacterium]|nr:hypothetical protein [Clostridia bacterium]
MGKKIDLFVLQVALAAAFYLYFRGAFQSRVVALVLALLSCFVLLRLGRKLLALLKNCRWMRKRAVKRGASGAVMRLACLPEEEAVSIVSALLNKSYGAVPELALVQQHPSLQLSEDRVFEIWRAHRGSTQLAICATCRADDSCRALAASLRAPRVALVDASALEQLICAHPEHLVAPQEKAVRAKLHLRRAAQLLVNRKNAPRNLVLAASMLVLYLFSGHAVYLFCALALLLLALISLRHAPRPTKLF